MSDLAARLDEARDMAKNGGLPIRRKDGKLYALLATCLAICEDIAANQREADLREVFRVSIDARNPEVWGRGRAAGNNGRGRRYANQSSDTYVLVMRYVLDDEDSRGNRSRYASALREAVRQGATSQTLVQWLTENGGINTLFRARPVAASHVTTKTLTLNQSVTLPKNGTVVLRLKMDHRGFFDVQQVVQGDTHAPPSP
jgi:hypothetical protein